MDFIKGFKSESLFDNELFNSEIKTIKVSQKLHWHDFYEIEYIYDGSGEYTINGVSYEICPNKVFISTPHDFHEIRFDSETKIINIQFVEDILNPDTYDLLSSPIVISDSRKLLSNILEILYVFGPKSGKYSMKFSKYQLNAALYLIATQFVQSKGQRKYAINDHFHNALVYINKNYKEEITLSDIARQVNLSPEYLSRLFKKHSGMRVSDYIISMRMNHAKILMKYTDTPVNEMASLSGYNSTPHFIREFKKTFGKSPQKLRKEYRDNLAMKKEHDKE